MSDGENSALLKLFPKRCLDQAICFGVDIGGRFVHNQHLRVPVVHHGEYNARTAARHYTAYLSIARAMQTSCRCPTEKLEPASLMGASNAPSSSLTV
jgi:hypothetical protein